MRNLFFLFLIFLFASCKKEPKPESLNSGNQEFHVIFEITENQNILNYSVGKKMHQTSGLIDPFVSNTYETDHFNFYIDWEDNLVQVVKNGNVEFINSNASIAIMDFETGEFDDTTIIPFSIVWKPGLDFFNAIQDTEKRIFGSFDFKKVGPNQ